MELSAARDMPCSLLELGSSAGLNLNLAHYDLRIGTLRAGDPASDVVIAPEWLGRTPRPGQLAIARAEGVDVSPLDVAKPGDSERLQAYIWPGERARSERLRAAIAMLLQYLPEAERLSIERLLSASGARAETDRPLARVGLEWNEDRSAVEVHVTEWDGGPRSGRPQLAARCHPYAEWFEWLGLER